MLKTTFSICILLFCLSLCAKENDRGVHAGLNIASMSLDPDYETDPIIGISVGSFTDIQLLRNASVSFNVNYSQKGYKLNINDTKYTDTYHYITIPVELRLTSYSDSLFRLYIGAGLSPNFCFFARRKIEFSGQEKTRKLNIDEFELSTIFSAGVILNNQFKIEANYDVGLSEINCFSGDSMDIKGKTRTLLIMFGVLLKL